MRTGGTQCAPLAVTAEGVASALQKIIDTTRRALRRYCGMLRGEKVGRNAPSALPRVAPVLVHPHTKRPANEAPRLSADTRRPSGRFRVSPHRAK